MDRLVIREGWKMDKNLLLIPRGGLGNQLHQFVLALRLCQQKNRSLAIDARHSPRRAYHSRRRVTLYPFALDAIQNFEISVRDSGSNLSHPFTRSKLDGKQSLLSRFPILAKRVITLDETSPDDFWRSDPQRISSLLSKVEISHGTLRTLRKFFATLAKLSNSFKTLHKRISKENIAGVRVRREDYTTLAHVYGEMSEQWYLDGLETILEENQRVLIFSDSTDAFERFTIYGEGRVVALGPEQISNPAEVLSLLAACSSQALSKPILSWWAMALGANFEKVAYPYLPEGLVQFSSKDKLPVFVSAEFIPMEIY